MNLLLLRVSLRQMCICLQLPGTLATRLRSGESCSGEQICLRRQERFEGGSSLCENMSSPSKEEKPAIDQSSVTKPKNISSHVWEKFKSLEKRTNEVTKRSTEKRIKHLQKTALENVARAMKDSDDRKIVNLLQDSREEVTSYTAKSDLSELGGRKKRHLSSSDEEAECRQEDSQHNYHEDKQWEQVRGLLGVNSHLAGTSHGHLGPKTVLELKIEEAIAAGDIQKAAELSDYMSAREFGEKVTQAVDARKFLEEKEKQEEAAKIRQQKKLCWGFEAKKRWETKSNM